MISRSDNSPPGTYNEDYHYFEWDELGDGTYRCWKIIVAENGITRRMIEADEVSEKEYFKRRLEGMDNGVQ